MKLLPARYLVLVSVRALFSGSNVIWFDLALLNSITLDQLWTQNNSNNDTCVCIFEERSSRAYMEMSCISSISFVNYYTDLLHRTGVRWGKKITTVVYYRVNIPICERLVLFVD